MLHSLHWNMWVLLALPGVWLGRSLIFFLASLISYIWTSGDRRVPALTPFTDETAGFLPMSLKHLIPCTLAAGYTEYSFLALCRVCWFGRLSIMSVETR